MTWWQAYGRDKAIDQMIENTPDGDVPGAGTDDAPVFTPQYSPGDKPLTVVLLPALFVGDWLWEAMYRRLNEAGWPVVQFSESISLVDRQTAGSINRMTARLLEVTRRHSDQPLVVCGDSLGGLIAFEFARSFPDETAGLVASGAPGLNVKVIDFARDLSRGISTPREFADRFLQKLLYDPSRHEIDQVKYQALVEDLSKPDSLMSIVSALRAISRYNSRKVVMSVDTPKLFLWGRQDEITPVEDWERALPRMKNARLVAFDECGHGPMFEKPDDFHRELVGFLDELVGAMPHRAVADERQAGGSAGSPAPAGTA